MSPSNDKKMDVKTKSCFCPKTMCKNVTSLVLIVIVIAALGIIGYKYYQKGKEPAEMWLAARSDSVENYCDCTDTPEQCFRASVKDMLTGEVSKIQQQYKISLNPSQKEKNESLFNQQFNCMKKQVATYEKNLQAKLQDFKKKQQL